MAYGYTPPPAWQPPKTTTPKPAVQPFGAPAATQPPAQPQYGSNTNWATGQTAWNPQGLFGAPTPKPGMTSTQAPTWNMKMDNPTGSTPGMMADPIQNTDVATAMPFGPMTFQDKAPQNQNVATPTPQAQGLLGNMPQAQPQQSQNPAAFNTQYATLENLQPYMNPFLDQIIAKGNKAIESSAAARGGLLSSRTGAEMGDWTTNAQIGAYGQAQNAFNADRGYMTDNYWKGQANDFNNYWANENHGWDMYKYGDQDYLSRLLGSYGQNQGLVNAGMTGAGNSGAIQMNLAQALASLYGEQGNVKAGEIMGSNSQQNGLLGSVLGMFLGGG